MTRLTALIEDYNRERRREDEIPMSQARLARMTGVDPKTTHRHANGKTRMTLAQAEAYARALGVPVTELLEGNGNG